MAEHLSLLKKNLEFRIIEIERKKDGKTIFFLTNILDLSKKQIADIHKHRWDIEALFQFSKARTQPQQHYLS